MIMAQAKRKQRSETTRAGKSRGLHSSEEGLRESDKKRHYEDTTHDYGNIFEFKKRG